MSPVEHTTGIDFGACRMELERSPSQEQMMRLNIFEAANDLLKDISFEHLTVKLICQRAHIARQTFYDYFCSKTAVFEWYTMHLFRMGVFRIGRDLSCEEGQLITAKGMQKLKNFYASLGREQNRAMHKAFGANLLRNVYAETIEQKLHEPPNEKQIFLLDAFVAAQADAAQRWIDSNMSMPPEKLAIYLASAIPTDLLEVLTPVIRKAS